MIRRSFALFFMLAGIGAFAAYGIELQSTGVTAKALCGTPTSHGTFVLSANPTQVSVGRSFTLSWCDPSWSVFDAGFGVSRYDVYYSRGGGAYSVVGSTTALSVSFGAESSDVGVSHRFFVRAVGTAQTIAGPVAHTEDTQPVSITVTGAACTVTAPELTVDYPWVFLGDSYTLSWTGVFTTECTGTYTVYRKRSTDTEWTALATVPQGTTTLTRTNTAAPAGVTYDFYVAAVGSGSSGSAKSNIANVREVGQPCPSRMCTLDGRFSITVNAEDWRTGNKGTGTPRQLNDLFGYFSIPNLTFNPDNPEVFVKVLYAGPLGYWVFYGTMTDFALKITVIDTKTSRKRDYVRKGDNLCGGADTAAFPVSEFDGIEPLDEPEPPDLPVAPDTVSPGQCRLDPSALCMIGGRFQAKLVATDQRTHRSAIGEPVRLNDLFGYFTLVGLTGNTNNPEVFVKVLDAHDGHFWVFYGGMTDLEYTLTVTDLLTTREVRYYKAPGGLCGGAQINAF